MMMSDKKKKLAMLIVGEKPEEKSSEDFVDKDGEDEYDMDSEAQKMCMKQFMKAVHGKDEELALHKLKELLEMLESSPKEEDDDE